VTLREGDFLTVAQVLRIVPLGKTTVYSLVDSGQLPSYRVSAAVSRRGRVLIARADLEAFIEGTRQAATRAPVRVDVDGLLQKVRRD
jgi:excisionase family DNA binding protein